MESSKNGLDRIRTSASKVEEAINNSTVADMTEAETKLAEEIPAFVKRYEDAMEDDLNTADAISVIFELVKFANTNVEAGVTSKAFAQKIYDTMKQLMDILGIQGAGDAFRRGDRESDRGTSGSQKGKELCESG